MRPEIHVRAAVLCFFCAAVAFTGIAQTCAMPDITFETASPLANKDSGKTETSVGNLVADAVRAALNTDVAFVASSELKPGDSSVPAGTVSSAVLAGLVSYADDSLAILELSGATIRAALERSTSIYPQPNMAFLQVSGLQFRFDSSNPPGRRVTSVTINGKQLADGTRYKVGMSSSLASGAVGYWRVWSQNDPKTKIPDTSLIKALELFLRANPKVDYSRLDRITAR